MSDLTGGLEQKAVLERAKTYLVGGRVFDYLPDEYELARDDSGQVRPYVVIHFGTVRALPTDRSLEGEEEQPHLMPFTVECWASTYEAARAVAGAVRQTFVGWAPTSSGGEITSPGGQSFRDRDSSGLPTRYLEAVALETIINAGSNDGEVIDPAGPVGTVPAQTILELVQAQITLHRNDPTPHPAYDDGPDLVVLFENRIA